ncbi:MAG: hypothetical protein ACFCAD_05870, partial [Pleurocapsa sp.]
ARGGANGGDGGLVEVAGKELLVFTGIVDAGSDLGQAGELLLDHKNITIGDPDSPLATLFNPNPEGQAGTLVGFAFSIATVGEDILIGAPNYDSSDGIASAGQAFLFDRNGQNPITYDNPNPIVNGNFAVSVAPAGNEQFLIGAIRNSSGDQNLRDGQVFLFDKQSTEPLQTYNNPNPDAAFIGSIGSGLIRDQNFGVSVAAIGDNSIIVGAPAHASGGVEQAGQAFLIDRNNGNLLQTLDNPNPVDQGNFGLSVSESVDSSIIIGAPSNTSGDIAGAGQAFLFSNDGTQLLTLDNPNPTSAIITDFGNFGASVAGVGNNLLIGAPENTSGGVEGAGQAFLFSSDGTQLLALDNPNPDVAINSNTFGGFGSSVAEVGDSFLIGAPENTLSNSSGDIEGAGQAFVFTNDGTLLETLDNPNPGFGNGNFGNAVAGVNSDTVIVGATNNGDAESGTSQAGEAFITRTGQPTLTQIESIENYNTLVINPGDSFAISPDTITTITNTGTDVTLQANNDIRITTQELRFDNPEGDGGSLTLQAGRSVDVNSSIVSDNGNKTIIANETAENGTQFDFRDPGVADITVSDDVLLDAGTGDVTLIVRDGGGDLGNVDVDSIIGDNINLSTQQGTVTVDGTLSGIDNTAASSIILNGGAVNVENPEEQLVSDDVNISESGITEPIIPDVELVPPLPNILVPEEITAEENETEIPVSLGNIAFERSVNEDNYIQTLLPLIDSDFTREYESYYGRSSFNNRNREDGIQVNLPQVKQNLKSDEESTGATPALIYVAFIPTGVDAIQGRNSNILPQVDDQLELNVITAAGETIRKQIKGVTRADVDLVARRFSDSIFYEQPETLF